jgi:hypothetical protein
LSIKNSYDGAKGTGDATCDSGVEINEEDTPSDNQKLPLIKGTQIKIGIIQEMGAQLRVASRRKNV